MCLNALTDRGRLNPFLKPKNQIFVCVLGNSAFLVRTPVTAVTAVSGVSYMFLIGKKMFLFGTDMILFGSNMFQFGNDMLLPEKR